MNDLTMSQSSFMKAYQEQLPHLFWHNFTVISELKSGEKFVYMNDGKLARETSSKIYRTVASYYQYFRSPKEKNIRDFSDFVQMIYATHQYFEDKIYNKKETKDILSLLSNVKEKLVVLKQTYSDESKEEHVDLIEKCKEKVNKIYMSIYWANDEKAKSPSFIDFVLLRASKYKESYKKKLHALTKKDSEILETRKILNRECRQQIKELLLLEKGDLEHFFDHHIFQLQCHAKRHNFICHFFSTLRVVQSPERQAAYLAKLILDLMLDDEPDGEWRNDQDQHCTEEDLNKLFIEIKNIQTFNYHDHTTSLNAEYDALESYGFPPLARKY